MKKDYCHISVVLDRSGSMGSIRHDTIGGFNTFLKTQKESPGEATLSLTQFDTEYLLVHSFVPIQEVPELNERTFVPRGATALYDAIGLAIVGCGEKLAALSEEERPEKVILVILTDGEENSSREYSHSRIQGMIKEQSDKYNWEFVFLGANIDAKKVGDSLGVKLGNTMTYAANSKGVGASFASMSDGMTMYRSMSAQECKTTAFFNADDEQKQKEAGA